MIITIIIIIIINITSLRSELSETRPICFKMLPKTLYLNLKLLF